MGREDGVVQDSIEREILIEAPLEVVWAVVTEPEHVSRWFSDAAEIDLRPGGAASLTWHENGGAFRARLERVEPPHTLAFRWVQRVGEEPAEGNSTLVVFSLRAEGEHTRLRVVESGFARLARSEAEKVEHHVDNVRGWALELDELRVYASEVASASGR
jgi:uncharacterized protein YndB with AHSA1/START domain